MDSEELLYVLALQNVPNIGDVNAKKLIAACGGSARQVFEERRGKLTKIDGIGAYTIQDLNKTSHFDLAEREVRFIQDNHIRYSFFTNDDYPNRLKHCIDGPIILFSKGDISLNQPRCISIVGTRKMTSYGKRFCENLMSDLAVLEPTIVSGFAYGIDIYAHRQALDHGLQTIACMAHGLNQTYPRAHERYVRPIEKNGGFVTDFWSSSKPDRENFLKRNRIIAGLSEATIVIESAEKGGSLVTASIANSYNREVFAVPGRSKDKYSIGCNNLIKRQQAHMITNAADLIYMLGWELDDKPVKTVQKQLFVELENDESKLYEYLKMNGKELLDVIALDCDLTIQKVSSTLLSMELKGVVRPLPGKLYEVV